MILLSEFLGHWPKKHSIEAKEVIA